MNSSFKISASSLSASPRLRVSAPSLLFLLIATLSFAADPAAKKDRNPSNEPAPKNTLAIEGLKALESGKLDIARARFQKLLESDPNSLAALMNLGTMEYQAKNYAEAEKLLKQATRVQPDLAAAWLMLGVATCEGGRLDAALAALAQTVLLEPSNAKAHSYLGVTLGRKAWLDGAEAELQRAIELDPNYADANFNLAVIYLQRKVPAVELARRHYQRALELGAARDSLVEKQLGESKE